MQAPLYLPRPGYIGGSSLNYAGGGGFYWSSTVNNLEGARRLSFSSNNINPDGNDYRYYGFSIRCVL